MSMKHSLSIFIALLLLLSMDDGTAQSYQAPKKSEPIELPSQNAFYIELLGSAGTYSLNYERLFVLGPPISLRGRIGASFLGGGFSFPMLVQASHPLFGPVEMEWGGGAVLLPRFSDQQFGYEWTGLAGFRYQDELGLVLRLVYTPFFRGGAEEDRWIKHWGGFSVGVLF